MAACEDCVARSMAHVGDLKEKGARFSPSFLRIKKRDLQKREDIRSAPRGPQFPVEEERIRRAFRRTGEEWERLLLDSRAAGDQRRSGHAAWSPGRARQTSLTSCISFLRRRRARR